MLGLYFEIPFGRAHLQSSAIKLTDMRFSTTLHVRVYKGEERTTNPQQVKTETASIEVICAIVVRQFVDV